MGLAIAAARRVNISRDVLAMDDEDVAQEAALALIEAADTLDESKASFSTHGTLAVRYHMMSVGRRIPGVFGTVNGKSRQFLQDRMDVARGTVVLDTQESEETNWSHHPRAYDNYTFFDHALLDVLNDREYEVIVRLFWYEETLQQVGERIGVTHQRVSAIRNKAIEKLRAASSVTETRTVNAE